MNSPTELRSVALRCPGYAPAFVLGWLVAVGFAFGVTPSASAQNLYWGATEATATWSTAANWQTAASGGSASGTTPTNTRTAYFNTTGNDGARNVLLTESVNALGMVFNNTGSTTLSAAAAANDFRFNIYSGGITVNPGAGDVYFGTNNLRGQIWLLASQTWLNNSSNTLSLVGSTAAGPPAQNPILDLRNNTLTVGGSGNTIIGSNRISGSAATAFIKAGTGKLTFNSVQSTSVSGSNANDPNFSGDVQINGGTVEYGRNGAIPSTADVLFNTASGTATFDTAGFNGTIASLTLGGSANSLAIVDTVGSGTGTLTLGGNVVYNATNNPGQADITGLLNLGAAARTFTIGDSVNATTDLRVAALVSGSVGLTKSGAGRMDLANTNNSYTGRTTISAGTLEVTGQLPGSGGITNNASLVFNSAANQAVSGAIDGTGGLQKLGAGSLSLTSLTNVYTGATAVDAGTLLVNGIHTGGAEYTVAAGATLGGSGGIFATVAGAGTISPGNSPGILAVRSVDPTAGTDFTFEMTTVGDPTWSDSVDSGNDVLRMFGSTPITTALTAANTVTVNFGMTLQVGDTIRGGFYTELNSDFSSLVNDAAWAYTFTGGLLPQGASIVRSVTQVPSATFADGTVTNGWVTTFAVVVVPEPSSLVLVSLGVMGLLWFRRR